jgi:hypothetical protein
MAPGRRGLTLATMLKQARAWRACALAFAIWASACSTVKVSSDYDRAVDFRGFRTFAIAGGKIINEGASDVDAPFVRERVGTALRAGLTARGLQPASERPDLLVTYVAGARTRQELERVVTNYQGGPTWYGPTYTEFWVTDHQYGTLVVDMVDASTRKLVWRAMAQAVDQPFADPRFLDRAVSRALADFPPRTP